MEIKNVKLEPVQLDYKDDLAAIKLAKHHFGTSLDQSKQKDNDLDR